MSLELWGRPAVQLTSRLDDAELSSVKVWVDAGSDVLVFRYSSWGSAEQQALFDEFVAAGSLTIG